MTNAEKYKDAIMAQMCKTGDWAVKKITDDIMRCGNCTECLFDGHFHCGETKAKWLKKQCTDMKKHFTEADKAVLRVLDKVQWVVRNKSGIIIAFWEKPQKTQYNCWDSYMGGINLTEATSAEFSAIQWEDDEPTSREETLGEEK